MDELFIKIKMKTRLAERLLAFRGKVCIGDPAILTLLKKRQIAYPIYSLIRFFFIYRSPFGAQTRHKRRAAFWNM